MIELEHELGPSNSVLPIPSTITANLSNSDPTSITVNDSKTMTHSLNQSHDNYYKPLKL